MNYLAAKVGIYRSNSYKNHKTGKAQINYSLKGSCSLEEILSNTDSSNLIESYRKTRKQSVKEQIILFTPSGYYSGKRLQNIEPDEKTNLVQLDIDGKENQHIDNWPKYRDYLFDKYKFIAVCGVSCGGSGLFILINTPDYSDYSAYFYAAADLLQSSEELNIDRSVSSPNELRYMTLNEDIVYRDKAKLFKDKASKPASHFEDVSFTGDGSLILLPSVIHGKAHRQDILELIVSNLHNGVKREKILEYVISISQTSIDPTSSLFGDPERIDQLSIDLYSRYADQFGQGRTSKRARISSGRDLPSMKLSAELTVYSFDKDDKPAGIWVTIIDEVLAKYQIFCNESGIYQYEATHWRRVARPMVGQFLRDCAIACGVLPNIAAGHRFVEGLLLQLESEAYHDRRTSNRDKLNFTNGTLDVKTLELSEHSPADNLFYCLPFDYDVSAACPKFEAYLNRVLPDTDLHKTIYSYIGCCFSYSKIEKMLCLVGDGGNGKSVLLDVLGKILGKDNVSHVNIDLIASINSNADNYRLSLENKIINISSESKFKNIDFAIWKQLASRETVTVHKFHQDRYEITDYARTIYAMNTLPSNFDEINNGFFRRLLVVPFDVTITDNININLAEEIVAQEAPGVMNKIVAAIQLFNSSQTIYQPDSVMSIIHKMEIDSDTIRMFMSDNNYIAGDLTYASKTLKEFYNEYLTYCETELSSAPVGRNKFAVRLARLGVEIGKRGMAEKCLRRVGVEKDVKAKFGRGKTAHRNGSGGG